MKNNDIREYAIKNEVPLWKIAEKLNIFDSTFSKKLRKELTREEKEKIIKIIDSIANEKQVIFMLKSMKKSDVFKMFFLSKSQ